MAKKPSITQAKRQAVRDEKAAIAARSPKRTRKSASAAADSFQNFGLSLGMGTQNALSGSTYGFNPITRVRTLLEWIYRGTWIGGVAVNLRAEDMTRAGIEINSTTPPDETEKLQQSLVRRGVWKAVRDTKKWASLYGGALGVILIDGQDVSEPLRLDTIGKNSFRGMAVLDRWMVDPSISQGGLVDTLGPDLGKPKFYAVRTDACMMPGSRVHYSRCLRLLGDEMPYWQSVMENLWGTSVYERIYDRLVAFDSATQGAAQSVYKSYIRTYKIDKLRELVTAGGPAYQGLLRYVNVMRMFQGIEGVTLLDAKDEFVAHTPSIQTGVSEALVQFGQQLCGALRIPAVRLFGMSPAGMNSTGESDWRNYYDGVLEDQETDLRMFLDLVLRVAAKSEGIQLQDGFGFKFTPLWQMTAQQKAEVADKKTGTVLAVKADGLYGRATALKELRQQSSETGVHTNITDGDIKAAEEQDAQEPPGLESVLPAGSKTDPANSGGEKPVSVKKELSSTGPAKSAISSALAQIGKEQGAKSGDSAVRATRVAVRDNVRLPLLDIGGLPILLECAKGDPRWAGGKPWPADYGYIRRTVSNEGPDEAVDCFVGPDHDCDTAYVINHYRPDGSFEEHKVMFGYPTAHAALGVYHEAYDGYAPPGRATAFRFTLPKLCDWLDNGDCSRPLMRAVQ